SRRGEGKSKADFVGCQKWRERPEFVEKKDRDEHAFKIYAQVLVIEADRGDEIAAQSDADCGGHEHYRKSRPGGGRGEIMGERIIGPVPMEQGFDIKNRVHYLNQREQSAGNGTVW